MRKVEDSIGVGCMWALLSVPVSLWVEFVVWPGFFVGLIAGFIYMYYTRSIEQAERSREALMGDLLCMRVAAENGWDLQDFSNKQAHELYSSASARSHVAANFYNLLPDRVEPPRRSKFRSRVKGFLRTRK